jgi:hypothetical protein
VIHGGFVIHSGFVIHGGFVIAVLDIHDHL